MRSDGSPDMAQRVRTCMLHGASDGMSTATQRTCHERARTGSHLMRDGARDSGWPWLALHASRGWHSGRERRLLRLVGQLGSDAGALSDSALGMDAAAVCLDQVLDDGEAESRATRRARAGSVHPVEALEDPGHVLGGDTAAVVTHSQRSGSVAS